MFEVFPQNVWNYGDIGPSDLPKIMSKRPKVFLNKDQHHFGNYSKAVVLFLINKYNNPTFQIMGQKYLQY